jgi:hypothetical protein
MIKNLTFKYITDQDYCRAKNKSGNKPLWKVYPMETRKLFPFYIFTNFSTSVVKGGLTTFKQRMIPNLVCSKCEIDLGEYGNGNYYTGYIVFDSKTEFYPCCPECLPDEALDYTQQIHGFRNIVEMPEKYRTSEIHNLIYSDFIHPYRYRLNEYKDGITVEQYSKFSDKFDSFWGYLCDEYKTEFNRQKYSVYKPVLCAIDDEEEDEYELVYSFPKKKIIEVINSILQHLPEAVQPVQLTLF